MDDYSIVEIFGGPLEAHSCGYCKTNGSISYGMWAHNLTVKDYQNLIDRGWRRCAALEFHLTKSQKKILRRMQRFLQYGDAKSENENELALGQNDDDHNTPQESLDVLQLHKMANIAEKDMEDKSVEKQLKAKTKLPQSLSTAPNSFSATNRAPGSLYSVQKCSSNDMSSAPKKQSTLSKGADPERPQCKKAKILRIERKLAKMANTSEQTNTQMPSASTRKKHNVVKTLRDYLSEPLPPNAAHKLEIKLVRSKPQSAEFRQTFEESYSIYKKYQMTIHGDPAERCTSSQYSRFLVNSPLEVKLVRCWPRSLEFKSTMEESYDVYALYQRNIHQESEDDFDKNTYFDFLVNSPLEPSQINHPAHPGYGSFHQQYWLDGKLIAVGVIDILSFCVSSVYFYYDPKYNFLSLGTYGALREIALIQELNEVVPDLKYYYMGFYIHSCQKMRYKGRYNPSMLLCPEAYTWQPIQQAIIKLNEKKYCRLDNRGVDDQDGKVDLNDVIVLHRRRALPYCMYLSLKQGEDPTESEEVLKYAKFVGKKCVGNLLLYRKS